LFKSFFEQTNEAINFDENTIKVISTFEKLFRDYKTSLASPKVYSMKSIVNYTLNELHFLPGQKERVELNLKDDFFAQVPKEPFAFVLSNLIRNAFKHGGRNKVQVTIKLENHKLIISDNGQGIPSSNLEKVFQMHYTTGQKGDSTGIGLGFSKIIVNSFYGEIWCESEEGKDSYTEFHIKFPEVSPSKITKESLSEMKEEGINEGERNQKEKIALKMLKDKKSIKEILEYTDLSRAEIDELKDEF
ncbi:MAG: hypothetical protein GY830_08130, partial [Bacteroidetes bacterium]|nr:hypothetical protein [Bacteroidota bacterium]